MGAVAVQSIEEVVGLLGIDGRYDARQAGIGDGSGRQTLILIGVIGAVHRQIVGGQRRLMLPQSVFHRGVDLEQLMDMGGQAIVNDRGDQGALLVGAGLLLDQRGHRHHLGYVHHGVLDVLLGEGTLLLHPGADAGIEIVHRREHLVRDLAGEVAQKLVDDTFRVVVHIEVVGVREQIALQPVCLAKGQILQELVVKVVVGRRVLQLLQSTDPVLRQHIEDLAAGVALREGQGHGGAGFAGDLQRVGQRVVIELLVQLKGACAELVLQMAEGAIELEQKLIVDQAVLLEILRHRVQAVALADGDGDEIVRLGQGQHIVRRQPHSHRQHRRHHQHRKHIRHRAAQAPGPGLVIVVLIVVILAVVVFVLVSVVFDVLIIAIVLLVLIAHGVAVIVQAVKLVVILRSAAVLFHHTSPSVPHSVIVCSVATASILWSVPSIGTRSSIRITGHIPMVLPGYPARNRS